MVLELYSVVLGALDPPSHPFLIFLPTVILPHVQVFNLFARPKGSSLVLVPDGRNTLRTLLDTQSTAQQ